MRPPRRDNAIAQSAFLLSGTEPFPQRQLLADLLTVIADDPVPERPGRSEPRARKRRPKPYPLLNKPRRQFKEIPHRSRYRKNHPGK